MKKSMLPMFLLLLGLAVIAQNRDFQSITPLPGSEMVNPEQTILLRSQIPFIKTTIVKDDFEIVGSKSGLIDFDIFFSDDALSVILKPLYPFTYAEAVTVFIPGGLILMDGSRPEEFSFNFFVRNEKAPISQNHWNCEDNPDRNNTANQLPQRYERGHGDLNGNNLPPDYPVPTVNIYSPELDDDEIFINLSNRLNPLLGRYITIWDKYGTPVFYRKTPRSYMNFHPLPDGTLTYCPSFSSQPYQQKYYLMDSSFVVFDSLTMGNGYDVDVHDILLLPNGHYLMMSYDPQVVDMSQIVAGGNPEAIVTGLVIQEVDRNQNVYFQWRSWDHFEITDATWDINLTADEIDYCHGNALDIDYDGHILLSSRNMDEITKIDYPSGDIMWRFGLNAKNNMFIIQGDNIGFSHQHDIRSLGNGNYTIYDNGNLHTPPESRALEYNINADNMIATLVWSYDNDPNVYAPATGSTRRLENGNTLIGWGTHYILAVTEVSSANTVAMEVILPDNIGHYRALKYPWKTNLFRTQEYLDFGNYAGLDDPKWYEIFITNSSNDPVSITSVYTMSDFFFVDDSLPLVIPGNAKAKLMIKFQPLHEGGYNDVITLNSDNDGNTERIARQIQLSGFMDETMPYVLFDPQRDAVNVDPSCEVKLLFSESMRLAGGDEITNENIQEIVSFRETNNSGPVVPFSGFIDENKQIITLYPAESLKQEQLYMVELLPSTVEDFDAHIIKTPEYCYFTTGLHVGNISLTQSEKLNVYPNPFGEEFILSCTERGGYVVRIFDAAGRVILEDKMEGKEKRFLMNGWKPGVYYISIDNEEMKIHSLKRIIKLMH